jgi:hypothetical protein
MANVLIDPYLFCLPSEEDQNIKEWLAALSGWLDELERDKLFTWFFVFDLVALLHGYNLFPTFSKLKELNNRFGLNIALDKINLQLDYFNQEDDKPELQLYNLRKQIEERGYLFEPESIDILPPEFWKRYAVLIQPHILDLYGTLAVSKELEESFANELSIATFLLNIDPKQIEVKTQVKEFVSTSENLLQTNPVIQKFPLVYVPDDLPFPLINTVAELWQIRDNLYPFLIFCDNIQKELAKADPTKFEIVKRRLLELNLDCKSWKEGFFNPIRVTGNPRPESATVRNNPKLRKQRTFLCPDGVKRFFELHTSMPDYWRLYYFPLEEEKKLIIGYIGEHLET